ncbi:DNA alkylation repair protein [soil metagenome]
MASASDVVAALADASDDAAARTAAGFFTTGAAEYGEDDVFIGVSMPAARTAAKRFADLPSAQVDALLWSEVHEHRMVALLIMVGQYRAAVGEPAQKRLVDQYLDAARAGRVNNWDLVDASAEFLVGAYYIDRPRNIFFALAKSDQLWERRIAIVGTFAFIKRGDATTTLDIAEKLLREKHDLIQKAVGWMLREVGKRVDRALLLAFLDENAGRMPRTMVSHAIEHLDAAQQTHYRSIARR